MSDTNIYIFHDILFFFLDVRVLLDSVGPRNLKDVKYTHGLLY